MKPSVWSINNIPAVCITLERRSDRWKRFQDQSGIEQINVKRFIGVDGKTINVNTDDRISTLTKRNIITKSRRSHEELDSIGGVGCALSHIAVWQWMVDQNQEICLVFEDDAIVSSNFVTKANEIIQKSSILKDPKHWDIWLLGGTWDDLSSIPNETTKTGLIRIKAFVLFHAYVITLNAAKRLLKDVYPIHCHIDIWVSIYSYLNDLRIVGTSDMKLIQNQKTKTDIQTEKGCEICNIPTDYEKDYKLVTNTEWKIAKTSEYLCIGLIAYIVYRNYLR
jgi:GR25 family glycosyltransferase involved in LPS biosynthesis